MHGEGQDAGGEHVVAHVRIPRGPHPLEEVEVHIVFGYLIKLAPIGDWRGSAHKRDGAGGVPVGDFQGQPRVLRGLAEMTTPANSRDIHCRFGLQHSASSNCG